MGALARSAFQPETSGSSRARLVGAWLCTDRGRTRRLCPAEITFSFPEKRTMNDVVITAALRTAVGKFNGSLAKMPAAELGAQIIKALLARIRREARADIRSHHGPGAHRRRRPEPGAAGADTRGHPDSVPGMTVNQVCGSGLKATHLAAQAIRCGDAEIVIAGGQENMSAAPHVLNGSRDGFRMGDAKLIDSMMSRRPVGCVQRLPHGRHGGEHRQAIRASRASSRTSSRPPRSRRPRRRRRPAASRMRSPRS